MSDQINKQPWTVFRSAVTPCTAAYPYIVRWYLRDRHTTWVTRICEFATLAEAVAAYKQPFRGISVDLMHYNGKPPGQHMDMLARRKAGKPTTKWHADVPNELRK